MKHITPVLITGLVVSLVAWRCWPRAMSHAQSAEKMPSYGWDEIYRILQESNSLDQRETSMVRFHKVLWTTREKLATGEATLDEAVDAVLEAARLDHPAYLNQLRDTEPVGRSDRERVALNLLKYIQTGIEAADYPAETHERLEVFRAEMESRRFQEACACQ
jgi:hypothetical protein